MHIQINTPYICTQSHTYFHIQYTYTYPYTHTHKQKHTFRCKRTHTPTNTIKTLFHMHTCIHKYIQTFIHSYIITYIHSHTCIYSHTKSFPHIQTSMHTRSKAANTFKHTHTHWVTRTPTPTLIHIHTYLHVFMHIYRKKHWGGIKKIVCFNQPRIRTNKMRLCEHISGINQILSLVLYLRHTLEYLFVGVFG